MKKSKKIVGMATAAILAMCSVAPAMMTTAFAASGGSNSITITQKDEATHIMKAYQVFKGNFSGGVLTNIEWGDGVNSVSLLSALQGDGTIGSHFTSCTTAQDVANVIGGNGSGSSDFANDSANMQIFADIVAANKTSTTSGTVSGNMISELPDGYYLVEDESSPTSVEGNAGARTRYILNVTNGDELTVQSKSSVPSVIKKVKEDDKNVTGSVNSGTYTANEDYNDVADYCIGEDVPFELIGTLPSTYDDYDGYYYQFTDTLADSLDFNNDVTVVVVNSGVETTLTPDTDYTVAETDDGFTVTFNDLKQIATATINKDSVIVVRYTAKLTSDAVIGLNGQENEVFLTYSNNPNVTGTGDTDTDTGKTPVDKVIVFTYELDVTKYADSVAPDNVLQGAGFKLKNEAGKYATVDGDFKITGWVDGVENGTEVTSGADGTLKFVGLDDGTYTLVETTVPATYNKIADKTFTITAGTVNNQDWDGTASTALTDLDIDGEDGDVSEGTVSMDVVNQKGSSLPSTGGIGTTVFYVTGGVLVVGAGILLVTKRRANKYKDE